MKVRNMENTNGNAIKNQFIITDLDKITFQSYDTMIIEMDKEEKTIKINRNFSDSATTNKYACRFMSNLFGKTFHKSDVMNMLGLADEGEKWVDWYKTAWKIIPFEEWNV